MVDFENSPKRILQKIEGNAGPASVKFHAAVNASEALSILKAFKFEASNEYIEFIDTCIFFNSNSIWVDTRDTPLKIVVSVLIYLYRKLRVNATWCIVFTDSEDQGVIYLSGAEINVVTFSDLVEFYKVHSIDADRD